MRIDSEKCVGCRLCLPYCPVGAIKFAKNKCLIDEGECVECYVCSRSKVCPKDAFQKVPLEWPRTLRHLFSSVQVTHELTEMAGRGTEEVKTNDVTGRYGFGEIGFTVDVGRPGVGTSFGDVEKIAKALAEVGVEFEPLNPVTSLMVDKQTGKLQEAVLKERVLSCIIECKTTLDKFPLVYNALNDVAEHVNTVFSVGCICRVNPDGTIPIKKVLDNIGAYYRPNGKTNIGLGRSQKKRTVPSKMQAKVTRQDPASW